MTSQVELGLNPGEALPAPQTPAAQGGMVLGSNGLWQYPSGLLIANDLGAAFTTASVGSTETDLLSAGAIAGAFPAMVAVGDMAEVYFEGAYKNNSGGNQGLTLNIYMGGILIATAASGNLANNATERAFSGLVRVVYTVSGGVGAGAVRVGGSIAQMTSSTSANVTALGASTATTVTSNAAQSVDLKGQTSTATTGSTVTCALLQVRYYPKNY